MRSLDKKQVAWAHRPVNVEPFVDAIFLFDRSGAVGLFIAVHGPVGPCYDDRLATRFKLLLKFPITF